MQRATPNHSGHSRNQNGNKSFVPVTIDPTQMFHSPRPNTTLSTKIIVSDSKMQDTESVCAQVVANAGAAHDSVSDMTQTLLSAHGKRLIVRDCVKRKIFPLVKFYDREDHHVFSRRMDTVCGIVLHFTHMKQAYDAADWWHETRRLVHSTHTVHRNNCIKAIQKGFIGKLWSCSRYSRYHLLTNDVVQMFFRIIQNVIHTFVDSMSLWAC
jgi:hypothetical protein